MDSSKEGLFILDVSSLPLERVSVLKEEDKKRFERYRQDRDKALFLGGRMLIYHFLGDRPLFFTDKKKPFFVDGPYFSISHSYPYVVLAYASVYFIGFFIIFGFGI